MKKEKSKNKLGLGSVVVHKTGGFKMVIETITTDHIIWRAYYDKEKRRYLKESFMMHELTSYYKRDRKGKFKSPVVCVAS